VRRGLVTRFARTPRGRGVAVSASHGASGTQSRAVLAGLPADVVSLALAPDVERLADAGHVPAG
jgi:sulfate transport system substrate-binding protein